MGTNSAVEIADLHVTRGKTTVFDGLDLTLPSGKVLGLLGPSGGGKTTLMRAIVGVQKISSGTVTVLGEPAGSPGLRRRVGYDTQAASVYDDLTVEQNLRYFARLIGAPRDEVGRVIDAVDLHAQRAQVIGSLSGGQRGRVSLATAMLGSPELLVLDEPTVGLDPVLRESLWRIFHALAAEGTTLLVSSHVMDEAQRCDEVVLVHKGTVIAHTTPAQLIIDTGTHDTDAAFLALIEENERQHPLTRRIRREEGSE